jgi:hypothetical protein
MRTTIRYLSRSSLTQISSQDLVVGVSAEALTVVFPFSLTMAGL